MADASPVALTVHDDHPLALELASLRAAVSRYQHEAHATSLKLQRHSLEASQAVDHARALERENARLKEEVAILRANPDTSPTQATFQVPEFTLALRRLSDKLTAVEEALLIRTEDLAEAKSELAKAQNEIEAARALAADARAREEEGLARERDLERRLRAAEEERKMSDLVVQEYAELVRKLEGRARVPSDSASTSSIDLTSSSNASTTTLVDSLAEGKSGLRRLLEEFNSDNERLEAEISKLHADNAMLYKELEVARLGAEYDRSELAKLQFELDQHRADDTTAAKMVSRYMKFSQSSTDTLQKAMNALKVRHAATLATFNAEIEQLQRALEHERTESDRVRSALDELTEDIAREAYGRRREVSLRLAFLGREENLAENLRRWIRRARESLERSSSSSDDAELNPTALTEAFARAVQDAEGLLELLNNEPTVDDGESPSGSVARLVLAQDAVSSLTHELQEETIRRLNTERRLAKLETSDHPDVARVERGVRPLIHPVPHRAHAAKPEKPLLGDDSLPEVAPSPAIPPPATSTKEAAVMGIPVEEIVITPSLDSSEPEVSEGARSRAGTSSSIDEKPVIEVSHIDTQKDPVNPSSTSNNTLKSNEPAASQVPEASLTAATTSLSSQAGSNDTPPMLFPTTATSSDTTMSHYPTRPADPHPPLVPFEEPIATLSPPTQPTSNLRASVPPPLQLDATDGSALSPLPSAPSSPVHTFDSSKEASLLASLAQVKHRYDAVQRGFRDCHLALKELKKSLAELPSPATASAMDLHTLLRKAVERLEDFNEDARVELEIRIADEERIASGYEALLSIPGAMTHSDDSENVDSSEMLKEIAAFVEGTDRVVEKANQSFSQKLDDLQHDIASIKRALHELALSAPDESSLSPSEASAHPSVSPKWSGWTPSFLSPSRSASPAPTFGSVMTSPRLRHSASFTRPRESPVEAPPDPIANLGLRIAVPSPVRSPSYGGGLTAGPAAGPQRAGPRQRTTSGMFMLGLGMRSTSFGSSLNVHHAGATASRTSLVNAGASPSTSRLSSTVSPKEEDSSGEGEDDDGVDSDIE
ncbi:hypothetical protein C8Q77DRAFT_1049756 [Trametes polyzona]|nr:hypothetical protein C8Q77DRAFT_1049756 [Trametes polyzona]